LPLSQTETGALATAPLSTVVNSATDALYQDLYNLVHGEVKIVSVAASAGGGAAAEAGDGGEKDNAASSGGGGWAGSESHAASVEEKLTAAALGVNSGPAAADANAGAAAASATGGGDAVLETRKQKMANLSFAQRRHELTRRIVQHTKSLAHVYALTAASLPMSHSAILQQKALRTHSSMAASSAAKIHDPPPRLGATVQVSSDALQFVKSGWVSQDEAQDALYFHHDGLWKARAHCHDVLGALCVLSTPMSGEMEKMKVKKEDGEEDSMQVDSNQSIKKKGGGGGRWPDFPTDVALAVDRYETSKEKSYSSSELQARLASAVRRKLVLGEVGAFGTLGSNKNKLNDGPGDDTLGKIKESQPLPWRVVLAKGGGGSIRLTYGAPRTVSTAEALRQQSILQASEDGNSNDISDNNNTSLQQYPMEARLSVLSEDPEAPWKLLSIHIRCSPKTGESDHQLVMNRKQMFDLHRIGERAMIVEEAVCRNANEELKSKQNKEKTNVTTSNGGGDGMDMSDDKESSSIVPRPLYRLFEVSHAFALSLQMEILSSQAEALRRGAWGGSSSGAVGPTAGGGGRIARAGASAEGIAVSPAYFFGEQKGTANEIVVQDGKPAPIAVMAVHFWSCDDRYGSPRVGDLSSCNKNDNNGKKEKDDASLTSSKVSFPNQRRDDNFLPKTDRRGQKRLSLCIRAVPTVGLVVSLSGGSDVVADVSAKDDGATATTAVSHHMQRNINKLLSSIQDPFQLSMSDALLAATVLCADRRCQAVVGALARQKLNKLPPWIHLEVECGTISVAAIISYPTKNATTSTQSVRSPTVLFRLACDSRTGKFVPVFPRTASLLRLLACNDPSASDVQSLRSAAVTSALGARLAASGGGSMAKRADSVSRESTGRMVRDAFDALSRSMDTLGKKCGVGGEWNDIDAQSVSLREKSVDQTCHDARVSLMTCSGMSAVFGVAAIALKIAGGVDPVADMAGGPISDESNSDLIHVPPLSVVLRQNIVEKLTREGDGEMKRSSQLQGELFAVSAKSNNDQLDLVCFDVLTLTESASSVPTRLEYARVEPPEAEILPSITEEDSMPPLKRPKISISAGERSKCHHTLKEAEHATVWFDTVLHQ